MSKGSKAGKENAACPECTIVVRVMNELRSKAGIAGPGFHVQGAHLRNLHARHQEHGLGAALRVARVKAHRWLEGGASNEMAIYYRPSTLFRPGHFPEYMAEPDPEDVGQKLDQWGRLPDGTYPPRNPR